jgi:SAM-dependent methyltransferase
VARGRLLARGHPARGRAIRETGSELRLRAAGGRGLRTRQAGRATFSGRILEPATGTGRVLIPLLEAGFTVEGLDISPDMLAVCRRHCRDRGLDPVLREADMTSVAEPGAYQAIIIPAAGPDSRVWTFHAVRPRS